MGLRFQKRIQLLPGVRLNLSKTGVSLTLGKNGLSINLGKNGATGTVGAPGTGVSYRKKIGNPFGSKEDSALSPGLWKWFFTGALLVLVFWLVIKG